MPTKKGMYFWSEKKLRRRRRLSNYEDMCVGDKNAHKHLDSDSKCP